MKYEVWMEGFRATGDYSPAQKVGEVEADTFQEACDKLCNDDKHYNRNRLTVWGCRLYDNEKDAREFMG